MLDNETFATMIGFAATDVLQTRRPPGSPAPVKPSAAQAIAALTAATPVQRWVSICHAAAFVNKGGCGSKMTELRDAACDRLKNEFGVIADDGEQFPNAARAPGQSVEVGRHGGTGRTYLPNNSRLRAGRGVAEGVAPGSGNGIAQSNGDAIRHGGAGGISQAVFANTLTGAQPYIPNT